MRNLTIVLFGVAAAAFAGCESPQTLHYVENAALMPALRVDCDLRYHFKQGWDLPAGPGTEEAGERNGEKPELPKTAGIGFRFFGDFSFRQVNDSDNIVAPEFSVVNHITLNPGVAQAKIDITREDVGIRFMLFSRNFGFTGGVGFFLTSTQMSGNISTGIETATTPLNVWGGGFDLLLEVCPGFQPLRIYARFDFYSAFEGEGYVQGSDSEFGLRGTWRGLSLFGGYRIENFHGKIDHTPSESLLVFEIRGPVFGIGVSF